MRLAPNLLFVLLIPLSFACGDNTSPLGMADATPGNPDGDLLGPDASSPDADVTPDAAVCPSPMAGLPGGACVADAECDSVLDAGDGFCLDDSQVVDWPAAGYCIRFGCDSENPCSADAVCTEFSEGGMSFGNVCMPACCSGDSCATGTLCTQSYAGSIAFAETVCVPGNPLAIDGDECATLSDCNTDSICRNLEFTFPGGMCTTLNCTLGDDSTCAADGDGHCVAAEDGNLCFDACTVDSDCRVDDGYECFDGGADGLYCRHRDVGEQCTADLDCGVAPWECEEAFPDGGYCTIKNCTAGTTGGCPDDNVCVDPDAGMANDQYCASECDPMDLGSCRVGYSCDLAIDTGGVNDTFACVPVPVI